ncbi:MAG: pyrimidine utilization protein B, partial [Marinomonas sp.]
DATYPAGPASAHDAALKNISTFFGWVASLEDYQNALSV